MNYRKMLYDFVANCEPNKSNKDLDTLYRYALGDKNHPLHAYTKFLDDVADYPVYCFQELWRSAEKHLKDML